MREKITIEKVVDIKWGYLGLGIISIMYTLLGIKAFNLLSEYQNEVRQITGENLFVAFGYGLLLLIVVFIGSIIYNFGEMLKYKEELSK